MTLSGYTVTQYRERDKLISVDLRAPKAERVDPAKLVTLAMPTPNGAVPLGTLGHLRNDLEYGVIWERDRQPTITVQSDVAPGAQGIDVTHAVDKALSQIRGTLPVGYRIEIGGSVEESGKGQTSINAQIPIMVIAVLTLLMIQLQSFARVLMVVLTAPLGLIGVVITLLLFGQPFGFVAMLGVIAMFGIIMRNSVILVDQIEQDIAAGHKRFDAIVGATVRRFRPITLTAAAAVLALIPLLRSNFFGPMATALMGGITSATILTLFYLPALYAFGELRSWLPLHFLDTCASRFSAVPRWRWPPARSALTASRPPCRNPPTTAPKRSRRKPCPHKASPSNSWSALNPCPNGGSFINRRR
jgi:multidrug efflux pump